MRLKLILAGAALVSLAGCVERRSPIDLQTHPASWNEPTAADFHGTRVEGDGPANCVGCHGADYDGQADVPGCYDCHDGPGGHPFGWADPISTHFHGDQVAEAGKADCAPCHASTLSGNLAFTGGWSGVSCYTCHAGGPSGHPAGWMDPQAAAFHGQQVLSHGVDDCTRCHGFGLSGGTSGVACSKCHN